MKKLLCVFLIFAVAFSLSACSGLFGEENQEETLITSQNSTDGRYVVYLYQVGSPQWSFGPVGAKLVLKDFSGKILDEESFELANDGVGVHSENIGRIDWLETGAAVLVRADESPEQTYVLHYDDQ